MTTTARVRVLILTNAPVERGVLGRLLASDPDIEVVGVAATGVEALAASAALAPNVITVDVTMPGGDGAGAVERIMAERPTPIVMVTAETGASSAAAIRALGLGAVDFVATPEGTVNLNWRTLRDELLHKIKMAARIRPHPMIAGRRFAGGAPAAAAGMGGGRHHGARRDPERPWLPCVVIAAATGGPGALFELVPALPADLPASVVITQHMPASYTAHLASALAERARLPVTHARAGERLTRGRVYVVPGSGDATVDGEGRVALRPSRPGADGSPSADVAMVSIARHAGRLAVAVILTGTGRDGSEGASAIRNAGGLVLAQDEASSMVYGMPRAAAESGAVHMIVPLARLSDTLAACLRDLIAAPRSLVHAS